MRKLGLLVAIFIAAILLALPVTVAATDPTVNITVIGSDGNPLANAEVTIYDETGDTYEGTTNSSGMVSIEVPSNATYLVVVKDEYYILDTVTVEGDTNKTVDASAMHYAKIESTPKTADITVVLLAFEDVDLSMTTNVTVYAPSDLNVTFPAEIVETPYKYVLEKIEYDGREETEEATVTLDMTEDYLVTAYYTKTFYLALEYWVLIILGIIVVVALFVAWTAGAKEARSKIEEWRERNRKFVKKKAM